MNLIVHGSSDQQLDGFCSYLKEVGWNLTGVSLRDLQTDLRIQREQRQRLVDLRKQLESAQREFLTTQGERFGRFMKALCVARAAFRDEPEVLARLDAFKRRYPRRLPAKSREESIAPMVVELIPARP